MKRILAFMLAFVMLLGTIPTAYATEAEELPVEIPVAEESAPETEPVTEAAVPDTQAAGIASGTAGSLTWEITEDYVLKITGNGAIPDYEYDEAPWSEYSWDVTSLELNEGITRIGNWAFAHFILETTPVIPESVTSIGDYAFRACNSMDGLKLPKSLASLGEYALSNTSLTDITIPAGITDLPDGIFYNCRQLSKVELPANLKTVGIQAFAYCVALETIDLPAGVTTLDEFAFAESGLKTIELPDSITEIGGDAFRNCTALESITLPSNLTVLNGGILAQTHSLKAITIPDSVKIIRGAFTQSEGLTEITIPASVEYMTGSTFAYCPNLQSVVFEGDLPMEEDEYSQPLGMAFLGTTTTVYYIDGNPTWDAVVGKNCGGQITWVAYPCDHPAMTLVPAKESTCTEQGYPAHYNCATCHKLFLEDGITQTTLEEILLPLAEHNYQDGECTACGGIPFTYYTYTDMNGEEYIAIWSYDGDDTELVIPAYIDGIPVTTLISGFLNEEQRAKITAIQLPETMKDIGSALCMCKALKEITIPAGVTELGYQAFAG